jgi:hypothetical protein
MMVVMVVATAAQQQPDDNAGPAGEQEREQEVHVDLRAPTVDDPRRTAYI